MGLVNVGGLVPGAAAPDAATVLASLRRGEADAHLVEHNRRTGGDGCARVGGRAGDGDSDDFADGLESGLGVIGDGGLDVPLALAAGADVLFGAAELDLGGRWPSIRRPGR